MSARQQIEEALKANPSTSLAELKIQLPDLKPTTLSTEFYRIKRKLAGTDQTAPAQKRTKGNSKKSQKGDQPLKRKERKSNPDSLSAKVFTYLDENPESKIADLRKAFPDDKVTTLGSLLARWRKKHPKERSEATKPSSTPILQDYKEETIRSLKETVAVQEKMIESLNTQIEMLTHSFGNDTPEELKALSLSEIKKIAAVYLKSLRELPARLLGKDI